MIKYPTSSLEVDTKSEDVAKKKLGYYFSERNVMDLISKEIGNINNDKYCRHPLTFLLEAADDIAYGTSDLEDAFKKKLFTINEFIGYLKKYDGNAYYLEIITLLETIMSQKLDSEFVMFHEWILEIKWRLMYTASFSFTKNVSEIMKGKYDKDLFSGTVHEQTLKMLKEAAIEFAFQHRSVLKLEIAGKKILEDLLNRFVYAAIHWEDQPDKTEAKYINIISNDLKNDYLKSKTINENYNVYLHILMAVDFISSMTDTFVKNLYKKLTGLDE